MKRGRFQSSGGLVSTLARSKRQERVAEQARDTAEPGVSGVSHETFGTAMAGRHERGQSASLALDLFEQPGRLPTDLAPAFARHETFAPRAGWLRKGFIAARKDRHAFLSESAHLDLGVGKNQARSIRYWAHACKLLREAPVPGQRSLASVPTGIGERLLGDRGWDPFLEDPASLWLLHWRLIQTPCFATAWHYAFTLFPQLEFTLQALEDGLAAFVAREYPGARVAPSSLHKDALLLPRMYGELPAGAFLTEETIQSPFAELGLIRPASERYQYRFETGLKPGLPAAVIVAACLEFAAYTGLGATTVAVARLLHDPGSPGMAFKLTESALCAAVEEVAEAVPAVTLADAAGLVQLSFTAPPLTLAEQLLEQYYRARRGVVAA